jgi:hypothetical protein
VTYGVEAGGVAPVLRNRIDLEGWGDGVKLRRALRLYAGLEHVSNLSYNNVRASTERLHRLMQYREWTVDDLRALMAREVTREDGMGRNTRNPR